jgi:Ni2+-binding GTPase involved in maturation of urease and hydrogenase
MSRIRYVMIGGFLGAGKTTAIARLGRMLAAKGRTVGIVTNDQAAGLVDTESLRSQGFDVGEVAGACFCCKFDELASTVGNLERDVKPNVILAEPVGSCTDLAATVLQPLTNLYGAKFSIAPYSVLLKPSHGLRILRGDPKAGFSPNAAYIFNKQLEEADVIVINRIDELSAVELSEIVSRLEVRHPGVPILKVSAKTGEGFDAYFEFLSQEGDFGRRLLDIDYDVYAAGEAELGWLNSSVEISANSPIDLDSYLLGVVENLRAKLDAEGAETAHLKTIGLTDGCYGVANLVNREGAVELSLPSKSKVKSAEVIVNARVAVPPERLQELVEGAVAETATEVGADAVVKQTQSFRPGRPVPTHRVTELV